MKTSVETVSVIEKRIRVEVPAEEVSRRIEEGFAEVRRHVPLRGFRKGKAPLSMVRRAFREHVESDVAELLVKESLADAVRANDLKVLSMARIDGGRLKEGEEFVFTATVEVLPEVEPAGYAGIPVERETVAVGDADVDAGIDRLRESFASYRAVEGRSAREGDLVECAFTAAAGGETLERAEAATILLGSGYPPGREFEERLAGVLPGEERAFEVAFPADHRDPRFAGRTVGFEVKVLSVREKVLPEADDGFAKNFSDVGGGMAELRAKMRERLVREAEERVRLRMEEQVRQALLDRNPFDVPRTLVDRQVAAMIEDAAGRMAAQGVDLKKVHMDFEKMRERFAPNAERAVRFTLLLEAVARKEGLDVPFSEIEAEMKAIAEGAKTDYGKVRELYADESRMDDLRGRLLGRKAMAFLLARADVREGGVTG